MPKDVDRPTPFYSDKTKLEMRGGKTMQRLLVETEKGEV